MFLVPRNMTYNSWVSTFMINEWSISIIISSKLMIQTTRWCPRLRHRKVGENNQYVTWMYGNYNHGIVYWFMALITRVVVLVRRDTSIYPYIPSISQSDWWVYKPTNTTGGIWGVGHHQTYQSSKSRSHSWCRFCNFFVLSGCRLFPWSELSISFTVNTRATTIQNSTWQSSCTSLQKSNDLCLFQYAFGVWATLNRVLFQQ